MEMLLEVQQAMNKSLVYQARANGNLGKFADGVALARKAYESSPNAEAARETGKWLAASGKNEEAVNGTRMRSRSPIRAIPKPIARRTALKWESCI